MAQKDMFISELLDRIAIVECEVRPKTVYIKGRTDDSLCINCVL